MNAEEIATIVAAEVMRIGEIVVCDCGCQSDNRERRLPTFAEQPPNEQRMFLTLGRWLRDYDGVFDELPFIDAFYRSWSGVMGRSFDKHADNHIKELSRRVYTAESESPGRFISGRRGM